MKKLTILLLMLTLVISLGACSSKESPAVKYASIIEDFVPDRLNVSELAVGDLDKPNAAVWCQGNFLGMVKTASTNESVVTVSSGGKVTAVGPGIAYVIFSIEPPIIGDLFGPLMHEVYLYRVY